MTSKHAKHFDSFQILIKTSYQPAISRLALNCLIFVCADYGRWKSPQRYAIAQTEYRMQEISRPTLLLPRRDIIDRSFTHGTPWGSSRKILEMLWKTLERSQEITGESGKVGGTRKKL